MVIARLLQKRKDLQLERSYPAPIETVWRAWTDADVLRQWWGPEKTTVPECAVDLRVGGRIYIVTEAGAEMGKYQGTRWPLEGTISTLEENRRLVYDARSWTEGEEDATIHHVNDLSLSEADGATTVHLQVTITQIGAKAKMAAFGMKWGYKQQLDHLAEVLAAAV